MELVAISARITGRVQGVAFRAWTRNEAERRSLTGWVRNASDGSVCALIMGRATDVTEMAHALTNGPPACRVIDVSTETAEYDPKIASFRIIR